ncbi:MAG TPA: hypothetical protein VNG52_06565 [Stellaceae bacterium]|nr:hypothetical protein [Stellaceae bacterium]
MRDRWSVFIALTVSSLAVLATGVTAGVALSVGTQPAALGLGAFGIVAASAGLLAIIRWMLDAEETYPDYRYRRAVAAGPASFAAVMTGNEAPRPQPLHQARPAPPENLGDNVIAFDPARARRRKGRAL